MRKQIFEKLNSRDGASISFALFAFIIATIVSLVIVAAALTNVIKLRQERENEQAYLVAESIANLLSEQMVATDNGDVGDENAVKKTSRYVRIAEVTDGAGTNITTTAPAGTDETVFLEPFKSVLEALCKERYQKVKDAELTPVPGAVLPETAREEVEISVSNVTASGTGKLSDDVVAKINDSDTKITCYMPETEVMFDALNGTEINPKVSDYYDMDFLIEVPTYGSKKFTCRMHFEAELKSNSFGNATYVYWPKATLVKGAEE